MAPVLPTSLRRWAGFAGVPVVCLLTVCATGACRRSPPRAPELVVLVRAAESSVCYDDPHDDAQATADDPAKGHAYVPASGAKRVYGFRMESAEGVGEALRSNDRSLPSCAQQFVYQVPGPIAQSAGASSETGIAVGHSVSTDPFTGADVWHTDWQWGECVVADDDGYPKVIQAWHRHPLGTGYAELMR